VTAHLPINFVDVYEGSAVFLASANRLIRLSGGAQTTFTVPNLGSSVDNILSVTF
jgi:hypothetical protein